MKPVVAHANLASAIIVVIAVAGCAVSTYGFAPGIMTPDAVDMFHRGQSLEFASWHSPTLQAVWAVMHRLIPGSLGIVLLLQLLYWAGFALIGIGLARIGSPMLGIAVALLALFPPSLHMTSAPMKDTFMAAFFLLATGLMVMSTTTKRRRTPLIGAVIFLCLAIATRPNAFAAAFPLIVFWLACSRFYETLTWRTWAISAFAAGSLYIAITHLERVALNPIRSHDERSVMIFDLGGITYFSGEDQFQGLLGGGFVERNAKSCYRGISWDFYNWQDCKDVAAAVERFWTQADLTWRWFSAIVDHPIAYLRHRLNHFGLLTRATTDMRGVGMWQRWSALPFTPSAIYIFMEDISRPIYTANAWQPFAWCLYLVAAFGAAFFFRQSFVRLLLITLASSGLIYMCFYLIVSVDHSWRYGYWTQITATVCSILAAGGLMPLILRPLVARIKTVQHVNDA